MSIFNYSYELIHSTKSKQCNMDAQQ